MFALTIFSPWSRRQIGAWVVAAVLQPGALAAIQR
jgi:hypothetical protein